jgi:tetratricopeptide (TPR) repeat protein
VLRAAWLAMVVLCAPPAYGGQRGPQTVTFNRHVAPILHAHCAACHRPGESAPFSLLTYDDARQRARLIATVTAARVMPPWQPAGDAGTFAGERRLTPDQIDTLRQWADSGAVEGDPSDRRQPPAFRTDWQLGTPDLVVAMSEPFVVPADGADVFRNFVLPLPLSERRHVRAVEFRPGNARVLHHARLLLDDTGEIRHRDATEPGPGFGGMDAPGARFPDGHFLGWAPGRMPREDAYPWPLEPGNDLVIQMHLRPTGRAEAVQSSVGFYFTDRPAARAPVMLRLGSKTIDIPAGEPSYEVVDTVTLPVDVMALSIYPHAHYLATEMTVTAEQPDGRRRTLLRIPRWNFNWQDDYAFAQPIALPRGTVVAMRYRYDNSPANPRNPASPPGRVVFGAETRDEMGELLLQVMPRTNADSAALATLVSRRNLLADIAGEEKRVADVPGDAATRNALGVGYIQLGRTGEAVAQFEAALRIDPGLAMAHYNLGVVAMGDNRPADAVAWFERALASRPDYAEAHNNLGVVLERSGRIADAEQHYRAALRARPVHPGAHNNLGRMLLERGALVEARAEFEAALRTRPDSPDVHYNLGRVLVAAGQPRQAVDQWRMAVAARPDSLTFVLDLAWLLATDPDVRDPVEAVRLAEGASRAAGNGHPAALDVLAASYAADGRIDLALRTARAALERAIATGSEALAREIRERVTRYEQMSGARSAERPGFP